MKTDIKEASFMSFVAAIEDPEYIELGDAFASLSGATSGEGCAVCLEDIPVYARLPGFPDAETYFYVHREDLLKLVRIMEGDEC